MGKAKKRPWQNTLLALIVLGPVMAFVVYSSLHLSDFECEVCITFDGREACRTVTGKTQEEGMRTGVDNACALLASGVTDSMRCGRTMPTKAECRSLSAAQ